jgi:hypothetical protein
MPERKRIPAQFNMTADYTEKLFYWQWFFNRQTAFHAALFRRTGGK